MKYFAVILLLLIITSNAEECNIQSDSVREVHDKIELDGYVYFPSASNNPGEFPEVFLQYIEKYGNLIAYEEESHFRYDYMGKKLNNGITIVTPKQIQTTASDGSTIKVVLHQDMSIKLRPPDATALMGVQDHPTQEVYTIIVDTKVLYDRLSDEVKECLQEPLFLQKAPDSYTDEQKELFKEYRRPILVMEDGYPMFKLRSTDSDELEPVSPKAKYCYNTLLVARDYVEDQLAKRIIIKKGDIIIMNNHKTLHSRDSFPSFFDRKKNINRMIFRGYLDFYFREYLDFN